MHGIRCLRTGLLGLQRPLQHVAPPTTLHGTGSRRQPRAWQLSRKLTASTRTATQDALPADGDYEVAEISFDEFRQLPRHSVMLLGNLGRDIEVRTTSTGKDVASVGLAVTVGVSPRDEQGGGSNVPYTQWYNLTFWQDAAHAAATNVRKGSQVLVIGNLSKGTAPNSTKERLEVTVTQLHVVDRHAAAMPAEGY